MIAGKDKGLTGTIIKVVTSSGKVSIEGVNIKTKHNAPRNENEQGSITKAEYPVHHSNVQLYSTDKGVSSRVKMAVEDGKKVGRQGCNAWTVEARAGDASVHACMHAKFTG